RSVGARRQIATESFPQSFLGTLATARRPVKGPPHASVRRFWPTPPTPQPQIPNTSKSGASPKPSPTPLIEVDTFRRLQGDAVLSNWNPHATLKTDIPDIPEFLQRRSEAQPAPRYVTAPTAESLLTEGPKGLPIGQTPPSSHMAGVTGPAPA